MTRETFPGCISLVLWRQRVKTTPRDIPGVRIFGGIITLVPPVLVSSFFASYQVYVYMKYAYIIYHMYFYVYKYIHTYPIGMISLEWEPIIPSNWVRWDVCLPLASRRLKVGHSGTITCAAISPDASFVVSTGSEAISGEPSNGTGTLKRLWCKTTRKGGNGWGKQISKNGSNQYFLGKTYGVFLD